MAVDKPLSGPILVRGERAKAISASVAGMPVLNLRMEVSGKSPLIQLTVEYLLDFEGLERLHAALVLPLETKKKGAKV